MDVMSCLDQEDLFSLSALVLPYYTLVGFRNVLCGTELEQGNIGYLKVS